MSWQQQHLFGLLDTVAGPDWHSLWTPWGLLGEYVRQRIEEKVGSEADLTRTQPAPLQDDPRMVLQLGLNLDLTQLRKRLHWYQPELTTQLGVIFRPPQLLPQPQLEPHSYRLYIHGQEVGRGRVWPDRVLAVGPKVDKLDGPTNKHFNYGKWVQPQVAKDQDCLTMDWDMVVLCHYTDCLHGHAADLMEKTELDQLLQATHPTVVAAAHASFSRDQIHQILGALLRERVSIRCREQILTILAQQPPDTPWEQALAAVRLDLGREVVREFNWEGEISCLELAPTLWDCPDLEARLKLKRNSVVCCPARLRWRLRQAFPQATWLAYEEIPPHCKLKRSGLLRGRRRT